MIPKSMSSTPIGDGNRFSGEIMRNKDRAYDLLEIVVGGDFFANPQHL